MSMKISVLLNVFFKAAIGSTWHSYAIRHWKKF